MLGGGALAATSAPRPTRRQRLQRRRRGGYRPDGVAQRVARPESPGRCHLSPRCWLRMLRALRVLRVLRVLRMLRMLRMFKAC